MLSPFATLILVHFVSDWFFQLDKWGANKRKYFRYLFYHSVQYALIFLPFLYFMQINLLWFFYLFLTHLYLDSYHFIKVWNKYIKRVQKDSVLPPWYETVQDQTLHILVLIPLVL